MSYDHLPLSERMDKAREYALMLSQDDIPTPDVPATLQAMFGLTAEQAATAFATMKTVHNEAYSAAARRRLWMGLAAIGVSVVMVIFYTAMAEATHPALLVLAVIFALAGLGALLQLLQTGDEYFSNGRLGRAFVTRNKEGKNELHWSGALLVGALFVAGIFGYERFSGYNILAADKGRRLQHEFLSETPARGKTKGKNSSYFYEFRLHHYNAVFRFPERYYSYADNPALLANLPPRMQLDLLIEKASDEDLREVGKVLTVYNLYIDGEPLYDLDFRNNLVRRRQDRNLNYALYGLVATLLLCVWRYRNTPVVER